MPPEPAALDTHRVRASGLILLRAALLGALLTVGLVFPAAMLLALVYRFPVPFVGYESGVAAVPHAVVATAFYGAFGGFPLLGLAGAAAGVLIHRSAARSGTRPLPRTCAVAAAIAFAAALTLSVLDKVIGPW
jgi:hypothetical protein